MVFKIFHVLIYLIAAFEAKSKFTCPAVRVVVVHVAERGSRHIFIFDRTLFLLSASGQFFWGILLTLCEVYITWEVNKFYKMLRSLDEGRLMRAMEQIHASHYGPRGI